MDSPSMVVATDDLKKIMSAYQTIARELKIYKTAYPPGHYYSPINNLEELRLVEEKVFNTFPRTLPGIDLNEATQLNFAREVLSFYPEMPFKESKQDHLRYFFRNGFYQFADGIFLYGMLRTLKPKRIIEIGSGYSSALMLDVNELFFNRSISCTFIEPDPARLLSLLKPEDIQTCRIHSTRVQDMDLSIFKELNENDILFIDSSHVAKANSDVNFIFFEILPLLKPGVFIHFHDIYYPFEYPKSWVFELGRSWNEAYMLRAFLQYNDKFKIQLFNRYVVQFFHENIHDKMPDCKENLGSNFWIKRVP